MIGTPTALSVRVSRKTSDGEYGSFEGSAEVTVNLPPEVDLEQAFDASDAWLTAAVGASMAEKRGMIAKSKETHEQVVAAPSAEVVQAVAAAPAAQAPVASDATYEVIEVKNFAVEMTKSGKRIGKAFGGKWTKFGVTFWPETAAEVGVELDACDLDRKYNLPAVYTHARVEMDVDKPKKVVSFEK